jgi:hypothetical protein
MTKGSNLPPTGWDVAAAKAAIRIARPGEERSLQVVTWLADEKLMLTATWWPAWLSVQVSVPRSPRCEITANGAEHSNRESGR